MIDCVLEVDYLYLDKTKILSQGYVFCIVID